MSDCVKSFLSVLHRALERERHFALFEEVPCQPKARSVIVSGQDSRSDPLHLFDPFLDHDYYFKLLLLIRRSRTPNQLLDALLRTITISGLSCVRTELFHLLVVPSLTHHPEQTNRQFPGHSDLGDLSSPPHRQVQSTGSAIAEYFAPLPAPTPPARSATTS